MPALWHKKNRMTDFARHLQCNPNARVANLVRRGGVL